MNNQNSEQKIMELDSSQKFIEILESDLCKNKLMVVDFFAPWCGPCLKLGDFLHELLEGNTAKQFSNTIFFKVNIDNDDCQQLVERFDISSIPRLLMFKNKSVVCDLTGFNPKQLLEKLNKHQPKTNHNSNTK